MCCGRPLHASELAAIPDTDLGTTERYWTQTMVTTMQPCNAGLCNVQGPQWKSIPHSFEHRREAVPTTAAAEAFTLFTTVYKHGQTTQCAHLAVDAQQVGALERLEAKVVVVKVTVVDDGRVDALCVVDDDLVDVIGDQGGLLPCSTRPPCSSPISKLFKTTPQKLPRGSTHCLKETGHKQMCSLVRVCAVLGRRATCMLRATRSTVARGMSQNQT